MWGCQCSLTNRLSSCLGMKGGVWGVARRRSESGHDGGWRLRVAALTKCEAAD